MSGRHPQLRRLRTVPTHLLLFAVVTVLAPLWLVVGAVIDAVRLRSGRPAIALRIFSFGWWYLLVGTLCLVAVLWHWLRAGFGRNKARMREDSYLLQEWWAARLFGAVVRLFRLRVEVEGLEVAAPGPVVVLMRHASIIDTLLPNVFLTRRARIRLRYVLKKELLADPTMDIAGNRLINYFVDRDGDSSVEVRAVAALAADMGPGEGVIIYPEGTRFTPERRERILAGLGERSTDLAERARALQRVLPPRPGGTGALLDFGHDVLVVSHTGLEPLATIPDAWSGRIVGARLKIRIQRFAGSDVPTGRRARVEWLFDRWAEIDAWITAA